MCVAIFFLSWNHISSLLWRKMCFISHPLLPEWSFGKDTSSHTMLGYTAFSWSLSNEKLLPYTLESITVLQGTLFIHTVKEDLCWQDPYLMPWRWWERDPTSYISSSFAPLVHQRWADLHAEPSYPAREVGLGSGMRASTSGGERIYWSIVLRHLLPSPPTPASARAQDSLLGSTRAAPCRQKQDFAPVMLCSLQSSAMGIFP